MTATPEPPARPAPAPEPMNLGGTSIGSAPAPLFSPEAVADATAVLRSLLDGGESPHDFVSPFAHDCICGAVFADDAALTEHVQSEGARAVVEALLAAPGVRREVEALAMDWAEATIAGLAQHRDRLAAALEAAERQRDDAWRWIAAAITQGGGEYRMPEKALAEAPREPLFSQHQDPATREFVIRLVPREEGNT